MFSIWLSSWESPLDSLAGLNLGPDAFYRVCILGEGLWKSYCFSSHGICKSFILNVFFL